MPPRLFSDGITVLVEVHDQAPGAPFVREAGADAEGGRGLFLVASIARDWGWNKVPGGKCRDHGLRAADPGRQPPASSHISASARQVAMKKATAQTVSYEVFGSAASESAYGRGRCHASERPGW